MPPADAELIVTACVQLFINDISPSPQVLGTVNALALTVTSGVRAFAPILFTSIFATGIKIDWADGHLIWFLIVALTLGIAVSSHFLPDVVEGKVSKRTTDSEA